MAFKVAELFAELKIDSKKFNAGLSSGKKKFASFSKGFKKFGSSLAKTGKQLAIFGGIAAGAFAVLAKKVGDFDTKFQQTLNLLSSADQAKFGEKLRAGVRGLSVEFGRELGDVTDGLFDLISAGASAEDALGQLRVGLKLSVGSAVSAGTAIDALTTVQNAFSLSAKDLALTSDFLFKINKAGKTTIEKLSSSIGNIASDASNSGVKIEELGASISTLTFKGVKTEQTMTKLKALFIELGKAPFAAQVRKLGIDFSDTDLKAKGLDFVLQKLSKTTISQRKTLTANSEALSSLNILLGAQTKFQKDLNDQVTRAGTVNKAYEDSSKTLGEVIKRLNAGISSFVLTIGEKLKPQLSSTVNFFAKLSKEAVGFLQIPGVFDNITTAVKGLALALSLASKNMRGFGIAAIVLQDQFQKLIDVNKENSRLFAKLEQQTKDIRSGISERIVSPFADVQAEGKRLIETFKDAETFKNRIFAKVDKETATRDFIKSANTAKEKLFAIRKELEDSSGTGGFLGSNRDKEDELAFIDKQIEKVNKLLEAKIKLSQSDALNKEQRALREFGEKEFARISKLSKKSSDDDFFTQPLNEEKKKQQERSREIDKRLRELIKKPDEVKKEQIKETGISKSSSFTTIDDFSKNIQLSFLDDKKDSAVKDNTKKTVDNTNALNKLSEKIAEGAGVAGAMLPLGV
jgi:TP901 family phage tail tape measure protein